jgi:PAS domain S-box-containing protein
MDMAAPENSRAGTIETGEARLLIGWVVVVAVLSLVVAVFGFIQRNYLAGLPVSLTAVGAVLLLVLRQRVSQQRIVDVSVVAFSLALFATTILFGASDAQGGGLATISLALTPPLFLLLIAMMGQRLYQFLIVLVGGAVAMILWLEVLHYPAIVAERGILRVTSYPSFVLSSIVAAFVYRTVRRNASLTARVVRSEQRYWSVFDGAAEAIILHTFDGAIIDANAAAEQMYGYSRNELIGRTLSVLSADRAAEREKRLDSIANGEIDGAVVYPHHKRADGSRFPAEVRATVFRDAVTPYCVAAIRDLSRVREQERRIAFQARILDSIAQSILVVDREGVIEYANEYTSRYSGVFSEELIGAPIVETLIADEDQNIGYRALHAALTGETWTGEVNGQTPQSSRVPTLIIATPIVDANNETEHIIVLAVDIRERKQMEQQLREAKIKAEEAARTKSVFLASMSHEIRNPLNGIIGFADLLMEQGPRDDQREALLHLIASGRSLLTILGDILSISKFDSGRYTLQSISFDLDELLARIRALYGRGASEKGLKFAIDRDSQTPTRLVGDPDRFQQLLGNLVSNAIKYTNTGRVTVHVGSEAGPHPDEIALLLKVTDTGVGIAESEIPRLFGLFERADNSDQIHGTGLGLAIAERLARSMDGAIEVKSEPGRGSMFVARVCLKVDASRPQTGTTGTVAREGRRSLRVLVVDDDSINQLVARRLLESRGHSVTVAGDGAAGASQAIAAATTPGSQPFDLILMDYVMPELDGPDATRRIRDAIGEESLIVGLSARVYKDDQAAMLEAGMSDVATKPITGETLDTLLERLFPESP